MFDIEAKIEEIPEPKTRELMKEVFSSYQHENYRATIIILWSVAIADIIFKLRFLYYSYNNSKAKKILEDVQKYKTKEEQMGQETKLIDQACKELKFISDVSKEDLLYLKKQRNASAHPLLNEDGLFSPSRDTTRALIRTTLEGLLLKPALLHSDLVNYFVEDLAINKNRLKEYQQIKSYIQKKFLNNISEDGAKKILQALWRFVFNPLNEQEQENKTINFQALCVCFENYKKIYIEEISRDPNRYQINPNELDSFISFLLRNNEVYSVTSSAIQTLVRAAIDDVGKFFPCTFLSQNLQQHLNKVLEKLQAEKSISLNTQYVQKLYYKAQECNLETLFFKVCVEIYVASENFDQADKYFSTCILPYLNKFDKKLVEELIQKSNENNQTYGRNRAAIDHKKVLEYYISIEGSQEFVKQYWGWESLVMNAQ